jgi:seryl-tRNA synthetase
MKFELHAILTFSTELAPLQTEITTFLIDANTTLLAKEPARTASIESWSIKDKSLHLTIVSETGLRPHNALLQVKNALSAKFGKTHHLGVRTITIPQYTITFELDRAPEKPVTIPFATVTIDGKTATMIVTDATEDFLHRNYIDRMITVIKEKVENQFYEGKSEFWKLIWAAPEKQPVWTKDPTEEMEKLGWLKQGPTKGKWFYRPQAAAILKTMEHIAIEEVLKPCGFHEVIESHIIPFDIWLKTGHLEGMPMEIYYVAEPATRDIEPWQEFIDYTKITKEVRTDLLMKNLSAPQAGICYAQCPMIYWSFKGKTIADSSLPVLVYDDTAISGRYESGGRHGIERVDEFHRIEPVYIGTREQLLTLRQKLLSRYMHVFNEIFELEWRLASVTPWYLQQAGKVSAQNDLENSTKKSSLPPLNNNTESLSHNLLLDVPETGTMDFEAYMPYRGTRKDSEWLEFQNLSILGDKYINAFTIKAQKSELWSGCSGIGLERWTAAFLAQKGIDPAKWPQAFTRYLDKLPQGIEFL